MLKVDRRYRGGQRCHIVHSQRARFIGLQEWESGEYLYWARDSSIGGLCPEHSVWKAATAPMTATVETSGCWLDAHHQWLAPLGAPQVDRDCFWCGSPIVDSFSENECIVQYVQAGAGSPCRYSAYGSSAIGCTAGRQHCVPFPLAVQKRAVGDEQWSGRRASWAAARSRRAGFLGSKARISGRMTAQSGVGGLLQGRWRHALAPCHAPRSLRFYRHCCNRRGTCLAGLAKSNRLGRGSPGAPLYSRTG